MHMAVKTEYVYLWHKNTNMTLFLVFAQAYNVLNPAHCVQNLFFGQMKKLKGCTPLAQTPYIGFKVVQFKRLNLQ